MRKTAYKVVLPSRASLQPDPRAAKRLAHILRKLGSSAIVVEIADEVAEAADKSDRKRDETAHQSAHAGR